MQALTDQVAVVTGAARGIGRGIASVLAAEGASVAIVDVDGELAATTAAELGGLAIAADVTDPPAVAAMATRVTDELGRIDIVAANAGIYPFADLAALTEEMWNRVMDLNVGGAVRTVQACLPAMRARGYGRIVLTSSITGPVTGQVGFAHYGASKAALLGRRRARAEWYHDQRGHAGEREHARLCRHERRAPAANARVDPDGPVRRAGGGRLGRPLPRLAGGRLHHRSDADRGRGAGPARSPVIFDLTCDTAEIKLDRIPPRTRRAEATRR
jgi:NAD(P)-dependent dehydrogenase (short-subunit alcohol dehydrogenase family)